MNLFAEYGTIRQQMIKNFLNWNKNPILLCTVLAYRTNCKLHRLVHRYIVFGNCFKS